MHSTAAKTSIVLSSSTMTGVGICRMLLEGSVRPKPDDTSNVSAPLRRATFRPSGQVCDAGRVGVLVCATIAVAGSLVVVVGVPWSFAVLDREDAQGGAGGGAAWRARRRAQSQSLQGIFFLCSFWL